MVAVPVADGLSVVSFNPAHRDRWRYDILGQISSQPLSSGRHFAGLQESDKAFGIIFPGSVDVSFNGRIGNIVPEHFQEMVLPFSVHHVIRNIRDILPLVQWIEPTTINGTKPWEIDDRSEGAVTPSKMAREFAIYVDEKGASEAGGADGPGSFWWFV